MVRICEIFPGWNVCKWKNKLYVNFIGWNGYRSYHFFYQFQFIISNCFGRGKRSSRDKKRFLVACLCWHVKWALFRVLKMSCVLQREEDIDYPRELTNVIISTKLLLKYNATCSTVNKPCNSAQIHSDRLWSSLEAWFWSNAPPPNCDTYYFHVHKEPNFT